jgi:ubiquinone/menaquinone biosynthesis C-methylase UbiE
MEGVVATARGGGRHSTAEERYGSVFSRPRESRVLEEIWTDAYGSEYPLALRPFGFVTWEDLRVIRDSLDLGPGDLLLDLGCGSGGPGLWLARQLDAGLIGIDVLPEAVCLARLEARSVGWRERAAYRVGSFTATKLPSASMGAVLSIDSLWMVADKAAAMAETARVLRPGSLWACTTWEPPDLDLRRLLREAGFSVLCEWDPPRWREQQNAVYAGIVANREALIEEIGPEATATLVEEASNTPRLLRDSSRRCFIARRDPEGGGR